MEVNGLTTPSLLSPDARLFSGSVRQPTIPLCRHSWFSDRWGGGGEAVCRLPQVEMTLHDCLLMRLQAARYPHHTVSSAHRKRIMRQANKTRKIGDRIFKGC